MQISDTLNCLFSAEVERRDGSYVVEIPEREVELGTLEEGGTYRVMLASVVDETESTPATSEAETESSASTTSTNSADSNNGHHDSHAPRPPVETGDTRNVEIEAIGDQGDGITRVERGFVVIVPDTDQGERVTIEVTDVRENVAFATVVERLSYYE